MISTLLLCLSLCLRLGVSLKVGHLPFSMSCSLFPGIRACCVDKELCKQAFRDTVACVGRGVLCGPPGGSVLASLCLQTMNLQVHLISSPL